MKYQVKFLNKALKEFQSLSDEQQSLLKQDYMTIQEISIDYVITRPLGHKIFEIKTSNLRSLFKYADGQIIIIGVIYIKQTQKTPKEILKLARKRFKEI